MTTVILCELAVLAGLWLGLEVMTAYLVLKAIKDVYGCSWRDLLPLLMWLDQMETELRAYQRPFAQSR